MGFSKLVHNIAAALLFVWTRTPPPPYLFTQRAFENIRGIFLALILGLFMQKFQLSSFEIEGEGETRGCKAKLENTTITLLVCMPAHPRKFLVALWAISIWLGFGAFF